MGVDSLTHHAEKVQHQASAAFTPTSPEEDAFRAALPDSVLLIPAGGFCCFPVQCNGTPGLLCLARDSIGAIQVRGSMRGCMPRDPYGAIQVGD